MLQMPSVITSHAEFYYYTKDLLKVNSIVVANEVPRVSILLHTDAPCYVDFLRICDKEPIQMEASYNYFLYDSNVYLHVVWYFTKPALLTIRFMLPVDKYYGAIMMMVDEPFIGLGFSVDDHIVQDRVYSLMAIPSINRDVLMAATILDGLSKLLQMDSRARAIAEGILCEANL